MKLVEIAPDIPIDKTFDYLPGKFALQLEKGCRVKIPFGKQKIIGWVVGEKEVEKPAYQYKKIFRLYDQPSLLPPEIMELAGYLAYRYCVSLGQALAAITSGFSLRSKACTEEKVPRLEENQKMQEKTEMVSLPTGVNIAVCGKKQDKEEFLSSLSLANTGSCLFLFPETYQALSFYQILSKRFPSRTLLFHGEMSGSLRLEIWRRMQTGKKLLVVSTRTGIFAPVLDLELIALDEPDHPGYLEIRQPSYHTLEIASWRAEKKNIPLVLTPGCLSVSQYYSVSKGQARIVATFSTTRAKLHVVSLYRAKRDKRIPFLTPDVVSHLEESILRKEKILILHTRQGSYRFLFCQKCDYRFPCPDCSVPMVPLDKTNALFCSFCEKSFPFPEKCPVCKTKKIVQRGRGLQSMETILQKCYPQWKIVRRSEEERVDMASAQILLGTAATEKIIEEFSPGLLLIPAADTFLNLPDFRSEERFFCLINRCRQKMPEDSTVVMQTYNPNLPLFKALVENKDEIFYQKELQIRKQLSYPPFSRLLKVEIETKKEKVLAQRRMLLEKNFSAWQMVPFYNGPGYPPVFRGCHRWKYLFKLESMALAEELKKLRKIPEVSLSFDPLEI